MPVVYCICLIACIDNMPRLFEVSVTPAQYVLITELVDNVGVDTVAEYLSLSLLCHDLENSGLSSIATWAKRQPLPSEVPIALTYLTRQM